MAGDGAIRRVRGGRRPGACRALLCLSVLGWGAGATRGQDIVALRSSAVVGEGHAVTLGDIAELTGAQALALAGVEIPPPSAGPAVDGWLRFDVADVRAALEDRDGIHWGRLVLRGAACSVRRGVPSRALPTPDAPTAEAPTAGPTVRDLVARRIADVLNAREDEVRLTFEEADRALLGTSAAGRTADIQMVGSSERQPVSVRLFDGLKIVSEGMVRVGVSVRRRVAVSTTALRRGDTVSAEGVLIEDRWLPPGRLGARPESVIGTVVRTRLAAGELIEDMDVEPPVVVKKGDLVDVFCLCGTVSVKTVVRALENGRDGEMVRVQGTGSKRSFLARMDGPGRAVTGLPGGVGTGGGTDVAAEAPRGVGGHTEAPAPTADPAGASVAEVGGVRVVRSARSEESRRADALRLRMGELADKALKKKELRP